MYEYRGKQKELANRPVAYQNTNTKHLLQICFRTYANTNTSDKVFCNKMFNHLLTNS